MTDAERHALAAVCFTVGGLMFLTERWAAGRRGKRIVAVLAAAAVVGAATYVRHL